MPAPRRPRRLPEVLGQDEVTAILANAPSPKHRTAFMLAYGSGLRTDEVLHLEPRHIDAQRMVIRVEHGKARNEARDVVLSPRLLEELRQRLRGAPTAPSAS